MRGQKEAKILLVGSRGAGQVPPSTAAFIPELNAIQDEIVKRMKILHNGGYTDAEREAFRPIVYSTVIQMMR